MIRWEPRAFSDEELMLRRERQVAEWNAENTDSAGYLRGWIGGVPHGVEDEVPENAHWKGWVW